MIFHYIISAAPPFRFAGLSIATYRHFADHCHIISFSQRHIAFSRSLFFTLIHYIIYLARFSIDYFFHISFLIIAISSVSFSEPFHYFHFFMIAFFATTLSLIFSLPQFHHFHIFSLFSLILFSSLILMIFDILFIIFFH